MLFYPQNQIYQYTGVHENVNQMYIDIQKPSAIVHRSCSGSIQTVNF